MRKLPIYEKSFASHSRSEYWSDKNLLKPCEVFMSSNIKYIFNCDKCDHQFEKRLNQITIGGWCPFCVNQKLCDDINCDMCNKNSFINHTKSEFWSIKNLLSPREVFMSSNLIYTFDCYCGHEFQTSLNKISSGRWCPYCCNPSKIFCNDINCKQCYDKSFASHPKSLFLSDKNKTTPRKIFIGTQKRYIFDCNNCDHEFNSIISDITKNNSWCPYCVNQKLCDDINCDMCDKNSFINHPKSKFWSIKNLLSPRQVFKGSVKKHIFDCNNCDHEFETSPSQITRQTQWCPYCANQKLCTKKDCKMCFEKSFASHTKSHFFSNKNTLTPRHVFLNSHLKYIFNCEKNHEFKMRVYSISGQKQWCPTCFFKTQCKLSDWLKIRLLIFESEKTFIWTKTEKSFMRYDFYIKDLNLIIELDGLQHHIQVSNWKSPEEQQITDKIKNNLAKDNNINLIRIHQETVFKDLFEWEIKLTELLNNKLLKNKVIYSGDYIC
jgi:very-short-patch-repair endonuclease